MKKNINWINVIKTIFLLVIMYLTFRDLIIVYNIPNELFHMKDLMTGLLSGIVFILCFIRLTTIRLKKRIY